MGKVSDGFRRFLAIWLGAIPTIIVIIFIICSSFLFKYFQKFPILSKIDNFLIHLALLFLSLWMRLLGIRAYEIGDDRNKCKGSSILLLSNHCNTLDTALNLQSSYENFNRAYFYQAIKQSGFAWLKLISQLRMHFVAPQGMKDVAQRFEIHTKEHFFPLNDWCILYPEGGLRKHTKEKSEAYARANNLPVFKHVSFPHYKGILAIFNALTREKPSHEGRRLEWVIDQTILYPEGMSIETMFAEKITRGALYVVTKLYHINEVPKQEEDLQKWLIERFTEKDRILEDFNTNQTLPYSDQYHPRPKFRITIILTVGLLLYLYCLYSYLIQPLASYLLT